MPQILPHFVVCLNNTGYAASLEVRKLYQTLPDPQAERHQMIRIIDESGEDYVYPRTFFAEISLPQSAIQALAAA